MSAYVILRDILSADQLIEALTRLKECADPVAPALCSALLGKAVPKPGPVAPRYTLNRSDKSPMEFILRADHLGKAAIKEKLCISTDRKLTDMKALAVPAGPDCGYVRQEPTEAARIKPVLFPVFKTKTSKTKLDPTNYDPLFVFCATSGDIVTYKGAFAHKITGDIVLLTADNVKPTSARKKADSSIGGWYVYKVEMVAPACFWNTFKEL